MSNQEWWIQLTFTVGAVGGPCLMAWALHTNHWRKRFKREYGE